MPISLEETLCDVKIMYNECTDFVTKERLQKLHIDLNKARMHKNKKYNKLLCIPSMLIGVIITIAIIILSFSTSTYADSIDVNITSYHPDKTYTYNKNNLGVGYTKDLNKHWQVQGGFYKNSYYKTSTYGLLNLKHDMKKWRWGISFGFVTGYNNIETKRTSERKINKSHKKEHWDSKSKYKESIAYHSHPQNLNKLQFIVLPNITWKINKKHALNLTYAPDFSKDVVKFIGFNYQYTIGD